MNGQKLFDKIKGEFDLDRMMKDAWTLSQWERYSGSEDGEKAADFICKQLCDAGVDAWKEVYDVYRSLPKSGSVNVLGSQCLYRGIPAVFSGEAKGVTGELVFDHWSADTACTPKINAERYASFKGKIVLTYDGSYSFYYEAARAGAIGIVGIWPGKGDHHDTRGGVWVNPGICDRAWYPLLSYG